MLELDNVVIEQGDFRFNADLKISPKQSVAILGPSGGGKSTLLLALAGFISHTGQIRWQGQDISALSPSERPISMLFQENNLFPHLTISQNVGLGIRPDLKLTKADRSLVETALKRVGLENRGQDLPRTLSGGQRQRAALARALLRGKPLLLLDEPFAALGPALRREMLDLVEEIRAEQQATLLLVTHNPEDALHIASECVFVDQNKANIPVATDDFFTNPPPEFESYVGS